MNFLKKMHKKAQLAGATQELSGFALGIFVLVVVVFAVMTGITTLNATEDDTNISSNLTEFLSSVGLFADYSDLIVIVGILAVVILLVVSAFRVRG